MSNTVLGDSVVVPKANTVTAFKWGSQQCPWGGRARVTDTQAAVGTAAEKPSPQKRHLRPGRKKRNELSSHMGDKTPHWASDHRLWTCPLGAQSALSVTFKAVEGLGPTCFPDLLQCI